MTTRRLTAQESLERDQRAEERARLDYDRPFPQLAEEDYVRLYVQMRAALAELAAAAAELSTPVREARESNGEEEGG